jgi:ribosomal protein L37E
VFADVESFAMTPRERLFKAKRADLRDLPVCVECLRCGRRNVVLAARSLPLILLTRRLKCSACGSGAVRAARARTHGEVQAFLGLVVAAQTIQPRRENG